jgi:hypothetical protein
MKTFFIICCIFFSFRTTAQLSGDIVRDGRQFIEKPSFVMAGSHNGKLVFDIAVNSDGEITAAKFIPSKSTITSTPARVKAQQYIADWLFEKGTAYPKFHQGTITITMVREL